MGRPRKQEIELTETGAPRARRGSRARGPRRTAWSGARASSWPRPSGAAEHRDRSRARALRPGGRPTGASASSSMGLAGLYGEHRPGRPRGPRRRGESPALLAQGAARAARRTARTGPCAAPPAPPPACPKSAVQRYLRPCSGSGRTAPKASGSPPAREFVEKARDVVGLYLNPPDNAVVLRVDESWGRGADRPDPSLGAEPSP